MNNPIARLGARLRYDFLDLIAPALCPACGNRLGQDEIAYCGACRASLDPAPFPRDLLEELAGVFPDVELALSSIGSLYTFTKEGPVQKLLHAVKYHGCYDLGVELGRELGRGLRNFREFEGIDLIVPVPLHRTRLRERGYNQAEAIGRGIADVSAAQIDVELLRRTRHTGTQTALSAGARRANVRAAFQTVGQKIRDRAVLLCDDVCTTGATLNECAEALLVAGASRVCAATVAKDVVRRAEVALPVV